MVYLHNDKNNKDLFKNLKIDCEKCFGFCCVALYFSASEGFPTNKEAGQPCPNLQPNFCCAIHKKLREKGLKGCTAFDCFGAGQKVAQVTYAGHDWLKVPVSAQQMFDVFLIMRQLHEMLWYLTEALTLEPAHLIQNELRQMITETERLTNLNPDSLIELDMKTHRTKVNALLLQTTELVRNKVINHKTAHIKNQKKLAHRLDFIGADLRKTNLIGADLGGALLIAANLKGADLSGANLIGSDLRDTDIRGADLAESIFLTQAQINTAKGDAKTMLPISLVRPAYWEK